jgi:hypothetical protein
MVLVLVAGVVIMALLLAYVASTRNPDQDKLKDSQVRTARAAAPEKRCASQATYDAIKRELFRRAAQLRGSDQSAYERLAGYAVVRMENPVVESEDAQTSAVTCSGSLSLDLPPGVAVVGGRTSLMADVGYTVQPAEGSGPVVLLRNADAIITPLATLARVGQPAPAEQAPGEDSNTSAPSQPTPPSPVPQAPQAQPAPVPVRPTSARPSFDCSDARTRGGNRRMLGCRSRDARPEHGGSVRTRLFIRLAGAARLAA